MYVLFASGKNKIEYRIWNIVVTEGNILNKIESRESTN